MDPVQAVIYALSGTTCGVLTGGVVVLLLSFVVGRKKVRSISDATDNLTDNTMAFTRTVSRFGDQVVRLGAAAPDASATTPASESTGAVSGSPDIPSWGGDADDAQGTEDAGDTWADDDDDDDDEDDHEGTVVLSSGVAKLVEDEDGDVRWECTEIEDRYDAGNLADEYGPLDSDDVEAYAYHARRVEMQCVDSPEGLPELVQSLGYTDVGHWIQVKCTFLKYFGVNEGPPDVVERFQRLQDAMVKAAFKDGREQVGQQAEQMREDGLLDPVEGVTCETYAALAAQQAQGLDQDAFLHLLADHDMDQAKYDRVAAEWQARMSRDLTATIATIYGAAFSGAGAGQFGAAGAAAGAVAADDGAGGIGYGVEQGAAGEAPIPFEKWVEIMGAQEAWSSQGKDVNAMLKEVFDMTALDWSNVSAWWTTHLMANVAEYTAAMGRIEEYAQQYGKVDGADDDVEF